jgi:hypothetical protein
MMRVALLTYSTKPRGGVVHTLALAESLSDLGVEVDVWTLGRDGDTAFFRPVAANVGVRAVPFEPRDEEPVGDRIIRSITVLAEAFRPRRGDYDIIHAQDCISANAAMNAPSLSRPTASASPRRSPKRYGSAGASSRP